MYNDTKNILTPCDTAPPENTPLTHSILEQDGEKTAKYSKDPNAQRDQVELQEHFQQLQEKLPQLEPTANSPTAVEELGHLTNKLQQLAVTLQLCPYSRPMEEPQHTTMQKYTDTLCATQ